MDNRVPTLWLRVRPAVIHHASFDVVRQPGAEQDCQICIFHGVGWYFDERRDFE